MKLIGLYYTQLVWLKIPNRPKTVMLNILLDHRTEIEQALIEKESSLRRNQPQ